MPQANTPEVIELTPQSLTALFHPMRVGILGLLRADGPATSSELARRLETNSGATSYHLRQLERHGFVAEVPDMGTARQRFWRAAHEYTSLERSQMREDAEAVALFDEFMHLSSRLRESEVVEWIESQDEWGAEWTDASTSDDYLLSLSQGDLVELIDGIRSLVDEMASRNRRDGSDNTESVRVHLVAFPIASASSALVEAAKEKKP